MDARILRIDLTKQKYEIDAIPDKIIKQFMGGRGLGSYLLYNLVPAKIAPLSPENHLIFTAGPSSGTSFYFSSKACVSTKSPLTGIYLFSISSGSFAHIIRRAGLWAIDIYGKSRKPIYLAINDDRVEFRDAGSLWGMDPAATQKAILAASPHKSSAVSIGRAGEQQILSAAIFSEGNYYRAFGRGGSGAVMGSKNLKGLAVTGSGEVKVVDEARFMAAKAAVIANIKANPKWADNQRAHGTGADLDLMHKEAMLPTRNWQAGTFEGWDKICTARTDEGMWPRKNIACGPYCPATCAHYVEIGSGPYRGAHCDGPEYETIYGFGSNCGIDKFDAIVAGAQICDEYGIDTMTAALTISFAMECFDKGLIGLKDTDGIDLRFGNADAMIACLKKIANREGFGNRLALGSKRLSEQIPGSEDFAIHVKGLELGGYECRALNGQALQYAVDARGGCHHAYGLPARAEGYDGTAINIEGKGALLKKLAAGRIMGDSFMYCTFRGLVLTQPVMAEAMSAISGENWTPNDFSTVAARIMAQERLFNMREGLTAKEDTLPGRLLKEPKPDGAHKGHMIPLDTLKNDYYKAMGWDTVTGGPTEAVLKELDITK